MESFHNIRKLIQVISKLVLEKRAEPIVLHVWVIHIATSPVAYSKKKMPVRLFLKGSTQVY